MQPQSVTSTVSQKPQFIKPENNIKKKVGYGGLNPNVLNKAEDRIQNNNVDFKPVAAEYLAEIDAALKNISDIKVDQAAVKTRLQAIIEPVMQIKAHSAMFKFDLLGLIADSFLRFLENKKIADAKTASLSIEYYKTMRLLVDQNIKGNGNDELRTVYKRLDEASKFLMRNE